MTIKAKVDYKAYLGKGLYTVTNIIAGNLWND